MNREIIFHENHFIEFYQVQNDKVKEKIKYVLELIKHVEKVPEKFLKHLTNLNLRKLIIGGSQSKFQNQFSQQLTLF